MRRSRMLDDWHVVFLGVIGLTVAALGALFAHTFVLQAELASTRAALQEARELAAFHKSTADYYGRELDACFFRRK